MTEIPVHRYRRELAEPPAARTLVKPYVLRTFRWRSSDVEVLHAMLEQAYAEGYGEVQPLQDWWEWLSTDAEFDPNLIFLVETPTGMAAAACIGWTSAFVKDLVVAPGFRRQGLASALLGHVFQVFRGRGAGAVELKVDADNHAAIALYEAMGMRRLPTAPRTG